MKFILVVIAFTLSCIAPAIADEAMQTTRSASVLIQGNFGERTQASGLLFDNNIATEVPVIDVQVLDTHHALAVFDIDTTKINKRTSLTAIARNLDGTLAYGSVKNITNTISSESYFTMPLCEPTEATLSMQTQISLLENLIRVRGKLRDNRKKQMEALLLQRTTNNADNSSETILERIEKAEKSFGFSYPEKLSGDTNPVELVERLYRVYHSLRNYRIAKGK